MYSLVEYRHLNVRIPVILVAGILLGETSSVAWVVEEAMEVLALILETSGITTEVEAPFLVPKVISSKKRGSLQLLSLILRRRRRRSHLLVLSRKSP